MRLAGVAVATLVLALAGSAPAGPAVAQGQAAPGPVAALAPGEVLLEVNGFGTVITSADAATIRTFVTGEGDDEAGARAAAEATLRRTIAGIRAAGAAAGDIHASPVGSDTLAMVDVPEAMNAEMNAAVASLEPLGPARISARATIEIQVRDIARLDAIRQAAETSGSGYRTTGVTYALNDTAAPRRTARAQALAQARAEAEAYAATLNMRVARIVRVTERVGLDAMTMLTMGGEGPMRQLFGGALDGGRGSSQIPTIAIVGVDFALAPR